MDIELAKEVPNTEPYNSIYKKDAITKTFVVKKDDISGDDTILTEKYVVLNSDYTTKAEVSKNIKLHDDGKSIYAERPFYRHEAWLVTLLKQETYSWPPSSFKSFLFSYTSPLGNNIHINGDNTLRVTYGGTYEINFSIIIKGNVNDIESLYATRITGESSVDEYANTYAQLGDNEDHTVIGGSFFLIDVEPGSNIGLGLAGSGGQNTANLDIVEGRVTIMRSY